MSFERGLCCLSLSLLLTLLNGPAQEYKLSYFLMILIGLFLSLQIHSKPKGQDCKPITDFFYITPLRSVLLTAMQ